MPQQRQAIHVRQLQIANHQVMGAAVKKIDCFGAAGRGVDRVTLFNQMLPQRVAHHWLVVDNQDAHVLIF